MGSLRKENKRPTSNITILRAKPSPLEQFQQQQRHDFNRSPVESPPIAKKYLKIKDDDGPKYTFLGANCRNAKQGKENCSILKSKNNSVATKNPLRHVNFKPDVCVFNFDRVAGDFVSLESQSLCTQSKDRKEFLNKTLQRKNNVPCANSDLIVSANKPNDCDKLAFQFPECLSMPSVDLTTSTGLGEVDFSFFEDESHRLWLKCIVTLVGQVSVDDILVRANTSGNKIRIVGCRKIESVSHQFNERYNLPMDVDPYRISARMDSISGKLFVEAPVKTE